MRRKRSIAGIALALALSASYSAQTQPRIRIVAPQEADYVTGDTLVRVAIEEAAAPVASVTISVDGAVVCTLHHQPFECRFTAGTLLRRRVIRAVAILSTGERAIHTVATSAVEVAATTGVEVVLVAVSVWDGGRFVSGLSQDRFQLFESGKAQPITFFAPEGWPCEVVLALDVSASMTKSLPAVRRAARTFLAAVGPDDHVSIAAFNNSFSLLASRTSPRAEGPAALERLTASGGTAMFDALLASIELLGGRDGRRAVVLFSDGEDKSSVAALDQVERRLLSEDVILYVIGYGDDSKLRTLREALSKAAQATGGEAMFIDDAEDAEQAFGRIVQDLKRQYTLGFTPSAASASGWRPLRVEVSGGRYKVRARQGYVLRNADGR